MSMPRQNLKKLDFFFSGSHLKGSEKASLINIICKLMKLFIYMQSLQNFMNQQLEKEDSLIKQSKENTSRLTIAIKKQLLSFVHSKNYLIFQGIGLIIAYNIMTREKFNIKVKDPDFIIFNFPPYIFACIIGQYIYFYPEKALLFENQVQKCKISKMNVKCLCQHNKGIFLGGYNRSSLPGGNFTNRRSIYYIQKLDPQINNKPIRQITLPKSNNPISILEHQNPYLLCYMDPHLYILGIDSGNILVSVQKERVCNILMLQGRFSYNEINILGISCGEIQKNKTLFSADMEKTPIYGIQITESPDYAATFCQSKDGRVFIGDSNKVYEYHPIKKIKKIFKNYKQKFKVMKLVCTHKNSLIVLVQKLSPQKSQTQSVQGYKKESFFQIFYLQ